jgi:hypothetical protein
MTAVEHLIESAIVSPMPARGHVAAKMPDVMTQAPVRKGARSTRAAEDDNSCRPGVRHQLHRLTTSVSAQAASHESQQTSTPDPSELAPAPSTWKGAFTDSLRLLLVEHSTRVAFQGKTRRELGGSFFGDYKRSLRVPDTWDDGDSWAVNCVGHPIHGAAGSFGWITRPNTTGWVDHVTRPRGD